MRIGHGMGGGVAADQATRRRWLVVLLALAMAATVLFASAGAANADGEFDPASIDVTKGDCSATITIENNTSGEGATDLLVHFVKVKDGPLDLNENITSTGPSVIEPGDTGEYFVNGLEDNKPYGDKYKAVAKVEFDYVESSAFFLTKKFRVNCDGEVTDCGTDCTVTTGDWEADIECSPDCRVIVRTPETNPDGSEGFADIEITSGDLKIKLTASGQGTPPGQGAVWADDVLLDKCTGNTTMNCVKINRKAGHTVYDITFGEDPRFKFR